jgi:transketolase
VRERVPDLERVARQVRRQVVRMSARAQAPHVGSALSCVDILVALYFEVARIDPLVPRAPGRDRVLLSKGQAAAALYACLAARGFFDERKLDEYVQDGSALAEHPSYGALPGVEATTGSLGHGLGLGAGMALAAKLDQLPTRVFVILSDGELNEGSVWEAALWAPRQALDNLVAVVDANGLQATARCRELTAIEPLDAKWRAFGWDVVEIDGHDMLALTAALGARAQGRPRAVVARTVKGKGVSFMQDQLEWHYRSPNDAELAVALGELEEPLG